MIESRDLVKCIILSVVTCGIYGIYWFICLTEDVNTISGEGNTSGIMALVLTLVTCGIYGYYWAYMQGEKIDAAKVARGMESGNNAIIYLVLQIFGLGIVGYALMQNELNKLA